MDNDRITRNPAPVIPGISDSVKVSAGDLLFISGAVGFEEDGSVPVDLPWEDEPAAEETDEEEAEEQGAW